MRKLLKLICSFIGSFIAIFILGIVILTVFVNPNRFKPLIAEQVMKQTGRKITIDQNLSWSFYPSIGVKIDHLIINNPAEFKELTFADLSDVIVSVKLIPLLAGKVESSGISLKNMKLNLIKDKSGNSNWQLSTKTTTSATTTVSNQANIATAETSIKRLGTIDSLDIDHADITWQDELRHQTYSLKNVELHAKQLQFDHAFPLWLKATIVQNGRKIEVGTKGDLNVDLVKNTLEYSNIKANVGSAEIKGVVNVSSLTNQPSIVGKMQVLPFDLHDWLKSIGWNQADMPSAKNIRGEVTLTTVAGVPSVQGQFKIDEFQANKIVMTAITATVNYKNNILVINPMTANLYQGKLVTQGKIDLSAATLSMVFDGKLQQVQLSALPGATESNDKKLKVSGLANADFHFVTNGNPDQLLNHLNGTTRFQVNSGVVKGVDIDYLIDNAYALATQKAATKQDTKQTRFDVLTGSAVIQNGVATNQDLNISTAFLDIKGTGKINLVNQQIDYSLANSVKKHTDNEHNAFYNLYGAAIPLLITGSLSHPDIRLDTNALLKVIAERQMQRLQEKAQDKVKSEIKEKLKGRVSDGAAELLGNLLDKSN